MEQESHKAVCFLNPCDNKNHGDCVKNSSFNSMPDSDSLNQNLWGKAWDAVWSDLGEH